MNMEQDPSLTVEISATHPARRVFGALAGMVLTLGLISCGESDGGEATSATKATTPRAEVSTTDGSTTSGVCERLVGAFGRFGVVRTLCEMPAVDYKGEIDCTLREYTAGRAIVDATLIDDERPGNGLEVIVVGYRNEDGERFDDNVAGPGERVSGVDVRTFIPRNGPVGIVTSWECAEPLVAAAAL